MKYYGLTPTQYGAMCGIKGEVYSMNRTDPVIPVLLKETGRSMRDPIPDPLKNNKLLLKLILEKRLTNVDTSTEVSKKLQIAAR